MLTLLIGSPHDAGSIVPPQKFISGLLQGKGFVPASFTRPRFRFLPAPFCLPVLKGGSVGSIDAFCDILYRLRVQFIPMGVLPLFL